MNFLMQAHSGWRYVVIAACAVALVNLLSGALKPREWRRADGVMTLAFVIVVDLQMLMGLVLWIWRQLADVPQRASWEHLITMFVVLALAHSAVKQTKRAELDRDKFKQAFGWLLIASIVIGVGIWRITTATMGSSAAG